MKYRTWFLATPIRYLAHVMYFGVPGTYGTSVPSERLFSKATARSNIKPKNVNMILSLNKNILCFGIVQWLTEIFWLFGEGRHAVSYDVVSVYRKYYWIASAWLVLPNATSNSNKIYMPADLDNFSRHWILFTPQTCAQCPRPKAQGPMPIAQCPVELLIYPAHDAGTCEFCGVCCEYSLTVAELWIAIWTLLYACVDQIQINRLASV